MALSPTAISLGIQGAGAILGGIGGLFGNDAEEDARAAAVAQANRENQQRQELIRGGSVSGLGDTFGKFEGGSFRDILTPESLELANLQRSGATDTARTQREFTQSATPLLQSFLDRIPSRESIRGDVFAAENAELNSVLNPAISDLTKTLTRTRGNVSSGISELAEAITGRVRGSQISQRPERFANLEAAQGGANVQNFLNPALSLAGAGAGQFNPGASGPSGLQTSVAQQPPSPTALPAFSGTSNLFNAIGSAAGNLGQQFGAQTQNSQLLDAILNRSLGDQSNTAQVGRA